MLKAVVASLALAAALFVAYVTNSYLQPVAAPRLTPQWWGPGKQPATDDKSIRAFTVNVSDETLDDLKLRLDRTRIPSPPLEGIHFQYGFNSDTLKKLLRHWRTDYDWRRRETFLNQYPQYMTNIQGLDIHYIHVKPQVADGGGGASGGVTTTTNVVVPLLLLHGWPGSVREFYPLIPLLTDQQESKAAGFAFEVIAPSLPGYGWSQGAARPGLGPVQVAVIFDQLMKRLGHDRWYVQGGDWGSQIGSHMAAMQPETVLGLHINMCISNSARTNLMVVLGSLYPQMFMEKRFADHLYPYWEKLGGRLLETGYMHIQATKPDTVGAGLADSPAGLAAYMLEKFSTGTSVSYRDTPDGGLTDKFTYTDLLDNVMIYWVTNSMTTAMRLYAEAFSKEQRALQMNSVQVGVPTWCARFPGELAYLPDWMLRHRYPQLKGATDMPAGGHFAAMEVPHLLAADIWMAVKHFRHETFS